MSIYDIDYDTKAVEWLPPDKRNPVMVNFVRALFSEIKYLAQKILTDYRLGVNIQLWHAGYTYAQGNVVVHQQVIYESLVNGNTTTPPSAQWAVYLPSYIGTDHRVKFNGQKLVLEYALNYYFFTNFRQPPLRSDIYITNIDVDLVSLRVGQTTGSTIAQHDTGFCSPWVFGTPYALHALVSNNGLLYYSLIAHNLDEPPSANWHQNDAIGYPNIFQQTANFEIHIPQAVYYNLNPDPAKRESVVRNFVDKLIPAGLFYTITIY